MPKVIQPHLETPTEELLSSITHGLGAVLSILGLIALVADARMTRDPRRIITVSIYGAALLLMYAASTAYHWVRSPKLKRAMRIFDHASIYVLIAGTYTPIVLISMGGRWGWSLFGVIWTLAAAGVVLKFFFVDRYELLSVAVYIMMGWLALVGIKPMLAALPIRGMAWIFAGGIAYTAGIVFYLWDRLPFNHAIWHLFVIAGSACHFVAVLNYVLPMA